ncbi:hypothetical protein [Limnohabitans sp. T6-5]|uniref:hypothetical protein n=1 Tax=Limnohabitans sp. T6-5 TaxID=1100724 RepID=UPI001E5E4C49
MSPWTYGVSTASLRMAFEDWLIYLGSNPSEQADLIHKAWRSAEQIVICASQSHEVTCKPCVVPMVHDTSFAHSGWPS